MKNLLLILLLPSFLIAMDPPAPAAVATPTFSPFPFDDDQKKLISFAESAVTGTLCTHKSPFGIWLQFPDFQDTPQAYTASVKDVDYAIRYMAALGLSKSIESDEEGLKNLADKQRTAYAKVLTNQRLAQNRMRLQKLAVNPIPLKVLESAVERYMPSSRDSVQKQALDSVTSLKMLNRAKSDLPMLCEIAASRFFIFWDNRDLDRVTRKDQTRDIEGVRQNRAAFFAAIQENDETALPAIICIPMIKKPARSIFGIVDRMIDYVENSEYLNNESPQTSDDEIL